MVAGSRPLGELRQHHRSRYFPYLRLLGNSIFFAGGVTIGTVLSCAAVGYGFARLRFPGRDILFGITLATLMIPPIVTFIPTYVLFPSSG